MTIDAQIKKLKARIVALEQQKQDKYSVAELMIHAPIPPNVRIYQRCPGDARFEDYWICDYGNGYLHGPGGDLSNKAYADLVSSVWYVYERASMMFPFDVIQEVPEIVEQYRRINE